MERITLKDSPTLEDKPKVDGKSEVQEVEVEPTQPLPKDWRFISNHSKDLIIGDVSKGVTTRSKPITYVGMLLLFHSLSPKTSSKPRPTRIDCLLCKKSSINLSGIKFGILFP